MATTSPPAPRQLPLDPKFACEHAPQLRCGRKWPRYGAITAYNSPAFIYYLLFSGAAHHHSRGGVAIVTSNSRVGSGLWTSNTAQQTRPQASPLPNPSSSTLGTRAPPPTPKRKRGRPKGSRNKVPRRSRAQGDAAGSTQRTLDFQGSHAAAAAQPNQPLPTQPTQLLPTQPAILPLPPNPPTQRAAAAPAAAHATAPLATPAATPADANPNANNQPRPWRSSRAPPEPESTHDYSMTIIRTKNRSSRDTNVPLRWLKSLATALRRAWYVGRFVASVEEGATLKKRHIQACLTLTCDETDKFFTWFKKQLKIALFHGTFQTARIQVKRFGNSQGWVTMTGYCQKRLSSATLSTRGGGRLRGRASSWTRKL